MLIPQLRFLLPSDSSLCQSDKTPNQHKHCVLLCSVHIHFCAPLVQPQLSWPMLDIYISIMVPEHELVIKTLCSLQVRCTGSGTRPAALQSIASYCPDQIFHIAEFCLV